MDNILVFFPLTFSSKTAIPIPLAAPDPAKPMKCPLPIFDAKSDAPTCKKQKNKHKVRLGEVKF